MARPPISSNQISQRTIQKEAALKLVVQKEAASLITHYKEILNGRLFILLQSDSLSVARSASILILEKDLVPVALRTGILLPFVQDSIVGALSDDFGGPPRSFIFTILDLEEGVQFTISW